MRAYFGLRRRSAVAAVAVLVSLAASRGALPGAPPAGPPALLGETGLYRDLARLEVDPRHLAFAPQYPLWTDGATKRRWISLPPDAAVDASDPDAWVFPVGTRFWKEFAFGGRRVETRYLELMPDRRWRYAAYEWSEDGRTASLAPERGRRGAFPVGEGRAHTIPGVSDCRVCHEAGGGTAVLGFSLLQLSPDRDPGAPHAEADTAAVDLADLVAAGLVVGLPPALVETPPRIAARTPVERSALGYMHGNCGHCHNADGPLGKLGLQLRHVSGAAVEPGLATTVAQAVADPAPGQSPDAALRIAPGDPARSALAERMGSRWAALQMPPLGTEIVDDDAHDLIREWIAELAGADARSEQRGSEDDDPSH
jgi:hypothetical protein